MDLQKQVTISFAAKGGSSSGGRLEKSERLALFEAVRRWTNSEGIPFDILYEGNRLTEEQIRSIARSDAYESVLMGFDERR